MSDSAFGPRPSALGGRAASFLSPAEHGEEGERTDIKWSVLLSGLLVFFCLTLSLSATEPIQVGTKGSGGETVFGDIVVQAEQTGGGTVSHGYTEYRFEVSNRGATQHTVEINAPSNRFNLSPGSISKIKRSVVLAPGTTSTITLYQPPLPVSGHSGEVVIDGTAQEAAIVFAPVYASGPQLRILGSRAVNDAELRTALELQMRPEEFEIQTAASEANEWSRNWLALSPYDAVVITSRELDRADPDVRLAIDRFARTGGVLVVLDALPSMDCAGHMVSPESLSFCPRGFGLRVSTYAPITSWSTDDVKILAAELHRSQEPLKAFGTQKVHPVHGPDFAVVENLSVPLRGLFIGMILFAIAAGPLNIAVLSKMNRRIWIIWTLPAIAIVTSLLVIVFASFSEGWVRASRTNTITWIDPDTREATTVGWTGYYATVAPSDGLRFATQTELHPYGGSRNNVLEVDWTNGQHLSSGWISSRVTSTFRIRKSEPRRERLTFRRDANSLTVSNGLGADVVEIWVADELGTVWTAKDVKAGDTKPLSRSSTGAVGQDVLRDVYATPWLEAVEQARLAPGKFIEPGRWAAILDGAPFVEDAMPGIRTRNARSLVMSELRFGEAE